MIKKTLDEFLKQGEELFGKNKREWKFRCISCGESQTFNEFLAAGASEDSANGMVHFSCIGRIDEKRGCNWTLGGLFTLHEKEVDGQPVFNFEGEPYSKDREKALSKKKTLAFSK